MLARLSLRLKLFCLAALALLTLAGVLTFMQDRLVLRALEAELQARAVAVRPILETALATPMAERDYATVQAVLREGVAAGSFAHMVLLDARGQLIASEGWSFGDGMPQPGRFTMADGEERQLYSIPIALAGQRLGMLHFGLSREPLQAAHLALLRGALIVGLACLALLVPLVEIGNRMLFLPMRRLEAAAERIRDGDYDVTLDAQGHDEVARLTLAFAQMAAAMRQRLRALMASEAAQAVLLENARLRELDLRDARDKAEIATRAKSEFLANMSHELRTPLNGILGMAQVLDHPGRSAEDREAIGAILDSGQQLLRLINDVLELSLFETGGTPLHLVLVPTRGLFAPALAPAAAAARRKGLGWSLDLAPDLPPNLRTDPARITQLLGHLAENAVKFTDAGGVTVSVTWRPRSATGGFLRVELRDTGIGIPPELRPRLFLRFTQAQSSSTRRFGGSGLGLAICRHVTELLGGVIGADGQPGQGSLFWFELPAEMV
ncbi:ATP-binding protein [Sediminicoccus sp. KRV36]|uniref:sensor histidine kinase n=1 Tax=Sediminicoccus sp. KRV36 TaxID=3133721 RepID=UPI00200DE1C8|nr:ATP-binding protein [Sediminicoccus rosea]UPY39066.1 HAMP domain-containing protein [Sediminicoccus rosea]